MHKGAAPNAATDSFHNLSARLSRGEDARAQLGKTLCSYEQSRNEKTFSSQVLAPTTPNRRLGIHFPYGISNNFHRKKRTRPGVNRCVPKSTDISSESCRKNKQIRRSSFDGVCSSNDTTARRFVTNVSRIDSSDTPSNAHSCDGSILEKRQFGK